MFCGANDVVAREPLATLEEPFSILLQSRNTPSLTTGRSSGIKGLAIRSAQSTRMSPRLSVIWIGELG